MGVRIEFGYQGQLRCTSTHGPSKAQVLTDAPVDNQGRGESFSPTDLVATALGSCMLTTMAIYAERHGVDLRGATATVEKEMIADPLRRIAKLTTALTLPLTGDHPQRPALERAALTCPVHRSLREDVDIPVTFAWGGE
jgi:putative redox protein